MVKKRSREKKNNENETARIEGARRVPAGMNSALIDRGEENNWLYIMQYVRQMLS